MDADEIKAEIAHQRILQKEYRKRLRVLEEQAAKFGIYVPPQIQIEIDELIEKIEACETKIRQFEALLQKFPDQSPTSILAETAHHTRNKSEENPRITSDDEFQLILKARTGYVYNDYSGMGPSGKDYNILHSAKCYTFNRSSFQRKYYFKKLDEAISWLRENRGEENINWRRCNLCLR